MLLLITENKEKIGFFHRQKAKKGKLPPIITGGHIGPYPAALLSLLGPPKNSLSYLAAYRERGDVLIADKELSALFPHQEDLCTEYARRLCVNRAIATLTEEEKSRRTQAVLIDKAGECVGVAAELLNVCNTVWVATEQSEWFAPCGEYTRTRYGNQPLFASNPLPKADLVVAPYGMEGWQYSGGKLFGPQGG
ncbi:MAG: hypothetical protein IKU10_04145, partial [Clostridia bacterium]|nr:hypothetical protein [Clostridia bacterium]